MTPQTFIDRWKNNPLTERAGAQGHFDDLCDLLGVEKPRDPARYCFEKGAKKAGGGDGWADVWKQDCFAWENKKPGRDLKAALKQLTDYALNLENPPLLIVCDREIIEIHTAFTGYPDEVTRIRLEELTDETVRNKLRRVFTEPEKFRPQKSTAAITLEVAGEFAEIAESLRQRGQDRQQVAHFLMQCLFCMFAEDEAILPDKLLSGLLERAEGDAAKATEHFKTLFAAMRVGGSFGFAEIPWFNGGLFEQIDVPQLTTADLSALKRVAEKDWRAIDPSIFGTLFERGLDPKSRAQLGAHYTDTATIEKLIRPLVREPLERQWAAVRSAIEKLAPKFGYLQKRKAKSQVPEANQALKQGQALLNTFLLRLENFRVLDPACGSGNFLYLALAALREVEKRARVEAAELGLQPASFLHTGPHNILGLEINEFAAELARVTVWIGDIQWCRQNGYPHAINPILKPLNGIERRDALLAPNDHEAAWPAADVIVGNPPFLGGSKKRRELGDDYFNALNRVFDPAVPGGADLVCYWFEKARKQILAGQLRAAGLVATNSIRGGANRKVLEAIVADTRIFAAWSDEPWVNEGAAVRVSLVAFGNQGTEGGVPDGAGKVPGGSGKSPDGAGKVPGASGKVPGASGKVPGASGKVPGASGKSPDGSGKVPDGAGKVPDGAGKSPDGSGKSPDASGNLPALLDGRPVAAIYADLTAGAGLDLSAARPLLENENCSFQGSQKIGAFNIDGELTRQWLTRANPNGRSNSDVLKFPLCRSQRPRRAKRKIL